MSSRKTPKKQKNVPRTRPRAADQLGQVSSDEYMVEYIEEKRLEPDGTWRYFIKWMGWPRETNTWEPIEHLTECEELLTKFEKEWAKKYPDGVAPPAPTPTPGPSSTANPNGPSSSSAKKPKKSKRPQSEDESSNYDSEEDQQLSKLKTKTFLEFGVLEDCPANKEPKAVLGVIVLGGALNYLVEWRKNEGEAQEGQVAENVAEERALILANPFKLKYPEHVIAFYEKNISLSGGDENENDTTAESAGLALAEFRGKKKVEDEGNDNDIDSEDGEEMLGGVKPDTFNVDLYLSSSGSESSDEDDKFEVDKRTLVPPQPKSK